MKTSRSVVSTAIIALFFSGCTQRPMNGFPQGSGHMMGYGGGMFMWLFWIFIVGVIAYFVFDRRKHNQNVKDSSVESPIEILKKRYARGEITKEEFDRLKKELEN